MKKFAASLFLIIFILFLQNNLFASACTALASHIQSMQITQRANDKDQPWRQINWVANLLGPANKKAITEQSFSWEDYSILMRNGKPVKTMGPIPYKLKNRSGELVTPTVAEATEILGPPKLGPVISLMQYEWSCKNSDTKLSFITDISGNVLTYKIFSEGQTTYGSTPWGARHNYQLNQNGKTYFSQ